MVPPRHLGSGGSALTLSLRDNSNAYAPHDSRIQSELQRFYTLARLETVSSNNTDVEPLSERFLEAAERAPARDISVAEMNHVNVCLRLMSAGFILQYI